MNQNIYGNLSERANAIIFMKQINLLMRKMAMQTHLLQFHLEWSMDSTPEWFDHYLDAYFQWGQTGNSFWLERGIFNLLAMKDKAEVLELCCGDGFNSKHFYSIRAKSIYALDFDKQAIEHAMKCNFVNNILFRVGDIRYDLPEREFDNIIWDAAIEHFTEEEIANLMSSLKKRLKKHGILSGYTIVERSTGKSLEQHEYEFKNKEDLMRFFSPHFKNINIFETRYPTRHNLYFWASDGIIPFGKHWGDQITQQINEINEYEI